MSDRPPLPPGPYLVVGLARSGEAAALALRARGAEVTGYDDGDPDAKPALAAARRRLHEAGVELGPDGPFSGFSGINTFIKSPGVPSTAPLIELARRAGTEVIGEFELAWRLLPNDFVAVTGTNGKTTTTEWIGHIHRTAGAPVAVAGNVGTALSTLIGQTPRETTIVAEVSSFQLEDTVAFAPEVAVLLNVTPDHLDRHGSFEAYREAKLRVFAAQRPTDTAVLPDDFPQPIGGEARRLRFGAAAGSELRLADARLWWQEQPLIDLEAIRLPGDHNVQNAMAAATACLARGLPPEAVAEGLATFTGVRHRLEIVTELRGVTYVNDSKATNVASTAVALHAYPRGVHLILGGQGKAQDFTPLAPLVAERCSAVYLIGEDAEPLGAALEPAGTPLHFAGDLRSAVELATRAAASGEVVLLSPACASFDQFRDFEARGDAFRELVLGLAGGGPAAGGAS